MISIVTITYNSVSTLEKTFLSVLNQSVLPAEYIVVDALSKDGTVEIIKKYERLFDEKKVDFKWISEKDNGIYDAMNKGALMASHQWIHFLNSDDYYLNDYSLETISPFLINSQASVVYGNLIKGDNKKQTYQEGVKPARLKICSLIGCPIQQPSAFYRKDIFNKYSFDTNYKISADFKFFLQLILDKREFKYVPVYITFFSMGGISTLNAMTKTNEEDIKLLKELGMTSIFMKIKNNRILYKPLIVLFKLISKL